MRIINTVIICLLTISSFCFAEEKKPTLIADVWTVTAKDGHESELYAAINEHVKFRADKGDPRTWKVYTPVVGKNLNSYVIRACCYEWSSQDSYEKWSNTSGARKHWGETADKHVKSYNHDFTTQDNKNTHWIDGTVVNYVGLNKFKVKNGSWKKMKESLGELSQIGIENNWSKSFAWGYPVSGYWDVHLAFPFENYAAMAPLEENYFKFVKKILKSEKKAEKLFKNFNSSIDSSKYIIYKLEKNLSMTKAKK